MIIQVSSLRIVFLARLGWIYNKARTYNAHKGIDVLLFLFYGRIEITFFLFNLYLIKTLYYI